ncbi:MAG: hypothetical protein ACRBDI_03410 [Alphaproteobacteria bacterium]
MTSLEEGVRERITRFLPKALERAITSYKMITVHHPIDKETKETNFVDAKKKHDACKVALAHVELLTKLARQTAVVSKEDTDQKYKKEQEELLIMLNNAEKEIAQITEI